MNWEALSGGTDTLDLEEEEAQDALDGALRALRTTALAWDHFRALKAPTDAERLTALRALLDLVEATRWHDRDALCLDLMASALDLASLVAAHAPQSKIRQFALDRRQQRLRRP